MAIIFKCEKTYKNFDCSKVVHSCRSKTKREKVTTLNEKYDRGGLNKDSVNIKESSTRICDGVRMNAQYKPQQWKAIYR